MSEDKSFFDTNVLLYLLSGNPEKADRAEALLAQGGVISVQILNEFAAVASRKLGLSYPEIREILQTVRQVCKIHPVTLETHDLGFRIAERYGFSFYDALIIAAALLANCSTLYSEDWQEAQIINGQLIIRNPFAGESWKH